VPIPLGRRHYRCGDLAGSCEEAARGLPVLSGLQVDGRTITPLLAPVIANEPQALPSGIGHTVISFPPVN